MSTSKTSKPAKPKPDSRAALAVEAMRRATREATTGPKELRSGRFTLKAPKRVAAE